MIKLNNHLEDTEESEPFTKSYAENCALRDIFISEFYFVSQQNNPDPGFK